MTPIPAPRPCVVCGRAGCGIRFTAPGEQVDFCSMECSDLYMAAKRKKIELKRNEVAAATAGGKAAGAYLEDIGKTDLREMTKEEWMVFCETMLSAAYADLQRQADEAVPF